MMGPIATDLALNWSIRLGWSAALTQSMLVALCARLGRAQTLQVSRDVTLQWESEWLSPSHGVDRRGILFLRPRMGRSQKYHPSATPGHRGHRRGAAALVQQRANGTHWALAARPRPRPLRPGPPRSTRRAGQRGGQLKTMQDDTNSEQRPQQQPVRRVYVPIVTRAEAQRRRSAQLNVVDGGVEEFPKVDWSQRRDPAPGPQNKKKTGPGPPPP